MKFDTVTYKEMINCYLSQNFVNGHSEYIRLTAAQMINELIDMMSDMDIPENLYITINFDDKPNNLKNTTIDLSNEIDFNDDF